MDVSGPIINLLLVLGMIPVMGFAAVWIVQRMVGGDMDVVPGVIGLCAIAVLFGTAILVPEQRMASPVLVIVISFMVFFPFAETQLERQEMIGIDSSRIDKAHRELSIRPENVAARFDLARALYDRGLHGHAIALAENTLDHLSSERDIMTMQSLRDKFRAEDSELKKWRRELRDPRAFDPVKCPSCGNLNPPGVLQCERCKGPYLLELARTKGGMRPIYGRLVVGFALTAGMLVFAAWAGLTFPWPMSAIGLFGGVAVIGALLTWIYRPRTLRD